MGSQQSVHRAQQKIGVFKKTEQSQVDRERTQQQPLGEPGPVPEFLDQQAPNKVADRGNQQQDHIPRLSKGVKNQTRNQQHGVAQPLGGEKIAKQGQREERIEKGDAGKEHMPLPFLSYLQNPTTERWV